MLWPSGPGTMTAMTSRGWATMSQTQFFGLLGCSANELMSPQTLFHCMYQAHRNNEMLKKKKLFWMELEAICM